MNEDKERKLLSLMEVRRHEAFWERQSKAILSAAGNAAPSRRYWLFLPAAAMAAGLVVLLSRPIARAPIPENALSAAFYEHMDMLADMDVLEAVREEEL